jgi:hypothetical protein
MHIIKKTLNRLKIYSNNASIGGGEGFITPPTRQPKIVDYTDREPFIIETNRRLYDHAYRRIVIYN